MIRYLSLLALCAMALIACVPTHATTAVATRDTELETIDGGAADLSGRQLLGYYKKKGKGKDKDDDDDDDDDKDNGDDHDDDDDDDDDDNNGDDHDDDDDDDDDHDDDDNGDDNGMDKDVDKMMKKGKKMDHDNNGGGLKHLTIHQLRKKLHIVKYLIHVVRQLKWRVLKSHLSHQKKRKLLWKLRWILKLLRKIKLRIKLRIIKLKLKGHKHRRRWG